MLKRTVYIGNPAYLKYKDLRLEILDIISKEVKGSVPIEDIAIVVLDSYQITISHQVINALQENNVAILSCNEQHLPLGLMLPLAGHVEHSERLKVQINVSEPLRKQLWKQTVESKISQQMLLLKKLKKNFSPMEEYLASVKSGDTSNMEGVAAKYYWEQLFDDFTRDRYGDAPNNLLNFGYAVLRSIVARAIVSSGMHPTLGIFHRNKYNAYCLADDVMEPYRPYVDEVVYHIMENSEIGTSESLSKENKAQILQIATRDVLILQKTRPLMVAVSTTTSSLYQCFLGEQRVIRYPTIY
ncbi:MAG: type II CRISPR-associated endonuclease Cas1 [Brumimicrobium sp.]|nr:type II CRISPR-associated endonuclease Cas1 [Brumimicrobium sp.]